ncbi:hypothetical protein [Polyangium aurulentum]|uniref:hypothetical protein n=1 Tax=Polyangium aurulentum TaxID=2567896 RepID=UPI0010AE29CE|nr:hypothetical protein [Polyangium aurulentum]UQA62410.1 hypothetical protein E8A73_018915 [Polyangium aurulentum]
MSKLSEQVQNQIRVSEKVIASARTHVGKVAAALAEQSLKVQGQATKATAEAFEAVILASADGLEKATADLHEKEQVLAAEKADDGPVRAARDNVTNSVAGLVMLLRSTVEDHLGSAALATYGLGGETPRVPAKLLNHVQNVAQLLEQNPVQITSTLGTSFDTNTAAKALKAKAAELGGHIKDDDREARELETALANRDRAAAAWSDAYQGTAATLEGLYRQAGWKELAEKVRPTQRKLRGEDAGVDVGEAPPAGG